jgi:hypothetical protein
VDNRQHREAGMGLATLLFFAFEPLFIVESFYNAVEMKRWLGQEIKNGFISKYTNLEWKDYKVVCDIILPDARSFHVGIDFGQQAVHVTLGPGDVYSLYYRDPTVSE